MPAFRRLAPANRHRPLTVETLETRNLLAADWQNPTQRFDINNDRRITAFDALVGIQRLHTQTSFNLGIRDPNSTEPYFDVNGDGKSTAFDVLPVINALNLGRPVVAAGLVRDTAPLGFNLDRLTSDPLIEGNVLYPKPGMQLLAWLDTPTTSPPTDLTASLVAGKFTLDQAALEAILGAALTDGPHTLHLETVQGASPATSAIDVSFVLDRQPPAPFAITGPTGARNNLAQTIAWEASAGAAQYELQITRQADGTDVVATFTTTTNTQAFAYSADGTYFTRVRAFDAAGNVLPASNQSLPVVIDTVAPGAFSITGPTGVQTSTTITLAWDASPDATSYKVQLHSDSSLSPASLISEATVTGTTTQLTAPGNGTFYVGVWGMDAANNTVTATNNPLSFQVQQVAEVVVVKDWISDSSCWARPPATSSFLSHQYNGSNPNWYAHAAASFIGNGQKLHTVSVLVMHNNSAGVINGGDLAGAGWALLFYNSTEEFQANPDLTFPVIAPTVVIGTTEPTNSNSTSPDYYLNPIGTFGGANNFNIYRVELDVSQYNIQTTMGATHLVSLAPAGGSSAGNFHTLFAQDCAGGIGAQSDWYKFPPSVNPTPNSLTNLGAPYSRATFKVTTTPST